jgi:hypothetical protein
MSNCYCHPGRAGGVSRWTLEAAREEVNVRGPLGLLGPRHLPAAVEAHAAQEEVEQEEAERLGFVAT